MSKKVTKSQNAAGCGTDAGAGDATAGATASWKEKRKATKSAKSRQAGGRAPDDKPADKDGAASAPAAVDGCTSFDRGRTRTRGTSDTDADNSAQARWRKLRV